MSVVKSLIDLFKSVTKAAQTAGVSEVAELGKEITEALNSASSVQKNRMETKLLRKQLEETQRVIRIASDSDVQRYDSKREKLEAIATGMCRLGKRSGAAKRAIPKSIVPARTAAKPPGVSVGNVSSTKSKPARNAPKKTSKPKGKP